MSNWYFVEIEALIFGDVSGESKTDAEVEMRRRWHKRGIELRETVSVELLEEIEDEGEGL